MASNTFSSVKTTSVPDAVVEQIETLILDGTLKPGERLPPERELAQQLEVSRPSLREAILKLEAKGLLKSPRGGGTFVADVVAPTLTEPLVHLLRDHPEAVYDILELRSALEEMAPGMAAKRATDSDLARLKAQFEALEKVHEDHDPLRDAEADAEFHMAIADASHNVALVHVMRGLFNLLRSTIHRNLQKLHQMDGNYDIVYGHHERIFQAIMEGRVEEARASAHLHIKFVDATIRELQCEEEIP